MKIGTQIPWLATAIVLIFATPLQAQEVWRGEVRQNSGDSNYTVIMELSDNGGQTNYPELKCGGSLTPVGQSGAYTFYIETITTRDSTCIDGSITVVKSSDTIAWGWVGVYQGQTFVAWSNLSRQ